MNMAADRTSDLAARPSRISGRGVFAIRPLPARRKVGEVTGRLVRLPAARRQVENRRRIFLVELTTRTALDCSAGNVLRHLNHACAPNGYLRVRGHAVEVYTLREVPAGEELTIDYGQTPHRGGMRCACGAPGCRGRL